MGSLFATDAKEAAEKLGVENNFATALKKARSEKKMLVLVIVKKGCRWCDKMVYGTLVEPEVKEALKNYVTLIVDKDDTYPNIFKEGLFPSIFYIDQNSQKSVYENVGYTGKKIFLNDLKESLKMRDELHR